jgi:hypothetical protein
LHVQAHPQSNEQFLRQRIHLLLKRHNIQQITVQIEKDGQSQIEVQENQKSWNRNEYNPEKMKTSFHVDIGT